MVVRFLDVETRSCCLCL